MTGRSRLEDVLPLTPLQEGLLFHSGLGDGAGAYVPQTVLAVDGPLDTGRLRRAAEALLRRHANLRCAFRRRRSGEAIAVVLRDVDLCWSEEDLGGAAAGERAARREALLGRDRAAPFDPGEPPLLRFVVMRHADDRHEVVLTNHHVLLDGWSLPLLVRDLFALYRSNGDTGALPPVTPYREYLAWLARQDRVAAEAAWAGALAGFDEATLVAPDAGALGGATETLAVDLPRRLTTEMTERLRGAGVTPSTALSVAWALLLGRTVGRDDVAFGTVVAGRPPELPGVEAMVGLFINTVPTRIRFRPEEPLVRLLARVQHEQAQLLAHQHLGLAAIHRLTGLPALFDTLAVFENYPFDPAGIEEPAPGLRLTCTGGHDATHYPLGVTAVPGTRLTLRVEHRPDAVGHAEAERAAGTLVRLFETITARPDLPAGRVEALSPAERRTVLVGWNATARDLPRTLLPDVLSATAARLPDATAVVSGATSLTFAELEGRVDRLARVLAGRGAGPEDVVAVAVPRSADAIVALLGVLRAGAAYLPMEPDLPAARVATMLEEARPALVVAAAGRADAAATAGIPVVLVDEAVAEAVDGRLVDDRAPRRPLLPAHPAYVIFTSGSTGRPKGVVVEHRSLANLHAHHAACLFGPEARSLGRRLRVALSAALSFDSSLEGLLALVDGHELHVLDDDTRRDAEALVDYVRHREIDLVDLTPSFAEQAVAAGLLRSPPAVVMLGGEAAGPSLWSSLRETPRCTGYNLYGPTECTVDALWCRVDEADRPIVGRPLANTAAYVLGAGLCPAAPGAVGELYLAGAGLARGYLGRPALTAERFVADPSGPPGGRMYRTGDLARWQADGTLEFVGRADRQVKIRGFRIEPGEIEAVLAGHPSVAQAAVVAVDGRGGGRRLVAYVVAAPGASVEMVELRATAASVLPDHMVPAAIIAVPTLPLTSAGKLDHRALPAPEAPVSAVEPSTAAERGVCAAFADVLGLERVGADDDFFLLGGDSIASMRLVALARAAGFALRTRDVFTCRTPRRLAAVAQPAPAPAAEGAGERLGDAPLLPVARALLAAPGPIDPVDQSMLVRAPAAMTAPSLSAALQCVLDHHDVLRARLVDSPGGPVLRVPPTGAVRAESVVRSVTVAAGEEGFADAAARAVRQAVGELAPRSGEMLRAVWLDAGPDRQGRLLLVAHHLVVDGVSWRILLDDLAAAWEAVAAGRRPSLPPPTTSYKRWAALLAERATAATVVAELPRWRSVLDGSAVTIGDRPLEPVADTVATARTRRVGIAPDLAAPVLTTVPAAFHGTAEDVLVAALALALASWQRRRGGSGGAVLVQLEGHGREEADVAPDLDLSRTVGWFTVEHPVRLDVGDLDVDDALAGGPAAATAVKRVKEQLRAVPNHGIGYGLLRHLNRHTAGQLAGLPAPRVLFNYLGRFTAGETADFSPTAEGDVFGARPDTAAGVPMAHVLTVDVVALDGDHGPRLLANWTWAPGVLAEDDVAALTGDWAAALGAIAAAAARPRAGGRTPSDLPLVQLDQGAIEALEAAEPALVDVLPLAPLQEGFLYHAAAAEGGVDVYTVQDLVDLEGPFDAGRFREAADGVLQRHPHLGAAFRWEGTGRPVQVVAAGRRAPWRDVDLTGLPEAEQAAAADRLASEDRDAPFDPARPPLLRFTVLRLGAGRHRVIFTCHHLLLDGWSSQVLARELFALYRGGEPALDRPAPSLRSYLAWLAAQDREAARAAWAAALAGLDQPTLVASRQPGAGVHRTRETLDLPAHDTARLVEAARAAGVTLSTVVQAAWALVLSRVTGRADVVFGQTVSGRPAEVPGADDLVGLLVNTVPVRVRLRPAETVGALLARVQDEQAGLQAHQHLGLGDVQRAVGRGDLFDTLVVVESYPVDAATRAEPAPGLRVTSAETVDATHYPLTLAVLPGDRLRFQLEYHPECFDRRRVADLVATVAELVRTLPADIGRPVAAVRLVPAGVRDRALAWGRGPRLASPLATVPELFATQVERTPDAPALVSGAESLTFAELDAGVDRLARRLAAAGAGPERVVALVLPRGVDVVTALLATMRAGAAYLPVDPGYPPGRIAALLADARPALVVTCPSVESRIPAGGPAVVTVPGTGGDLPALRPLRPPHPDHPAYVVYTSGSTGRPKGVVVSHRSVANLFHSHRETLYRRTAAAAGGRPLRVGHTWSFAFDASWQPLLWMLDGHALHVLDEETLQDPALLAAEVRRRRLDFVEVSPSLGAALMDEGLFDGDDCPLLALGLGGEAVPDALWAAVRRLRGTEGYNLYGPTETTVDALAARVRDSGRPLVGRPTANTCVYVLDEHLRPVEPGAPGELYLAGAGLARGYLRQPARTAERFVADPFGPPGTRMYRTGDLARWSGDGRVDYLGRSDDQVKVRGFRVEPGEIAAVLEEHAAVARAVVTLAAMPSGERSLVAYAVAADPGRGALDPAALRDHLRRRLPRHMLPAAVVEIAAIPLTAHGKIDRAALPAPPAVAPASARARTALEAAVCEAFAGVLGIGDVDVDADFFDLGGHSLLLVKLRSRLTRSTGASVAIAELVTHTTPADLAVHLAGRGIATTCPPRPTPARNRERTLRT